MPLTPALDLASLRTSGVGQDLPLPSVAALSLDLATLRAAYAAGTLTPTALVEELLRRIDAHGDPAIFIHLLSRDTLLAHAARLEKLSPASLPLYGVPFAIKDNIDLAGAPTTAACPEFTYTPAASATVVQRLLDAGAIPLGKTNLDQFATGLVGVRSPYGVPRNPFDAAVIPGGSSSGSAVAVAAGLCSFSLGTDTAGSGRVPAGLNNLVGLKPTKGALSTRGVVPACRSLDCVSIFALTCADAAEIQHVTESFDSQDPFSRPRVAPASSRPSFSGQLPPGAPPLRIGVPAPRDLEFFGDAEAAQLFAASLSRLTALGATVVEIDFAPFRETAALLYQGPWVAERWAALRAFHATHADAFFPVTRKIVEGANALSAADTFEGFYKLAALARRAAAEWEKMDTLLLPTAPRPYTLAEVAAEPLLCNTRLGTYTNFVNLLDLSAVAVPAGLRTDGLPWGVTFLAPAWRDPDLLALAARWHTHVGGHLGATATPLPSGTGVPPVIPPRGMGVPPMSPPTTENPLSPSPNLPVSPAPATVRLAVVGAHLTGLPLNRQLTDLGARLVWSGTTSPSYRLFALPHTTPPKPGLLRITENGSAIAVEVWEFSTAAFGTFVAAIPSPLCIGTVTLSTGESVKGFLCEPAALAGATDITSHGGWRAYLASL